MISVKLFKMEKHSDFHLGFFQIVGAWRDFAVVVQILGFTLDFTVCKSFNFSVTVLREI